MFLLYMIAFIAVSHINDATDDGSRLSWIFCEIVSPFKNRDAIYFLHVFWH